MRMVGGVALILLIAAGGFTAPAAADHLTKLQFRSAIRLPDDCAFIALPENPNEPLEPDVVVARACAEAFREFKDWPNVYDLPKKCQGHESEPACTELHARRECDSDYSDVFSFRGGAIDADYGVTFYNLAPGKFLVELPCGAGAYNVKNAYLFYDETTTTPTVRRLSFPYYAFDRFPGDEDNTAKAVPRKFQTKLLSSRTFNRRRKELIVLLKARGMGDAGSFARYRFREDGEPILKEFRFKLEWDGRYSYSGPSPRGWRIVPVE
jgi:hypothetical protein